MICVKGTRARRLEIGLFSIMHPLFVNKGGGKQINIYRWHTQISINAMTLKKGFKKNVSVQTKKLLISSVNHFRYYLRAQWMILSFDPAKLFHGLVCKPVSVNPNTSSVVSFRRRQLWLKYHFERSVSFRRNANASVTPFFFPVMY